MTDVILTDEEAERQRGLLLGLQVALDGHGIRAVLARNHHLGLPTEYVPVSGVCGQKPPSLYVFAGLLGMVRVQVQVSEEPERSLRSSGCGRHWTRPARRHQKPRRWPSLRWRAAWDPGCWPTARPELAGRVRLLGPDLRDLIGCTQAAVDSAVLAHRRR